MFKIIKTSTYNRLVKESEQREELIDSLLNYEDQWNVSTWGMTDEEYDAEYVKHAKYKIRKYELALEDNINQSEYIKKLQLHHLTAKKLSIKKSKNK